MLQVLHLQQKMLVSGTNSANEMSRDKEASTLLINGKGVAYLKKNVAGVA